MFITVHNHADNGKPHRINAAMIRRYNGHDDGSYLEIAGANAQMNVRETPDEIDALIGIGLPATVTKATITPAGEGSEVVRKDMGKGGKKN